MNNYEEILRDLKSGIYDLSRLSRENMDSEEIAEYESDIAKLDNTVVELEKILPRINTYYFKYKNEQQDSLVSKALKPDVIEVEEEVVAPKSVGEETAVSTVESTSVEEKNDVKGEIKIDDLFLPVNKTNKVEEVVESTPAPEEEKVVTPEAVVESTPAPEEEKVVTPEVVVESTPAPEEGEKVFTRDSGENVRAILVNKDQMANLEKSGPVQETIFNSIMNPTEEVVISTTKSIDELKKEQEMLLSQATSFYNAGNKEEAEKLYNQISEINKIINSSVTEGDKVKTYNVS